MAIMTDSRIRVIQGDPASSSNIRSIFKVRKDAVERHCIVKPSAGRGTVGEDTERKRSPFPGDAKTPNPILSHQPPASSTVSLYGELFSEYFGKMNVVSVILEGNEFAPSLTRECIVP